MYAILIPCWNSLILLAKAWHSGNTQGICKQLNPLSLDQGLYLPDCRIWEDAYGQQFFFFVHRQLSCFCIGRFLQVQHILLVHLSILFRAVENMSSTIVNDICSFISLTPQKKFTPLRANAVICHLVFLLLDCLLIFSSNSPRQFFLLGCYIFSIFNSRCP